MYNVRTLDKRTKMETWKISLLAPVFVEVSSNGNARSSVRISTNIRDGKPYDKKTKSRPYSPWISKNGYYCISVMENKKRVKYLLHRLIASAFCPGFNAALTVNHKDGNKLNNTPDNLEWVTLAYNNEHAWQTDLVNLHGENQPTHKLSLSDIGNIRASLSRGTSIRLLSAQFGVSESTIYKIRSGTRWAQASHHRQPLKNRPDVA